MILILVFLVVPLFWIMVMSFQKGALVGPLEFVGLSNYLNIFKNSGFVKSILNTLKYAVIMVPVAQVVTFSISLLLYSLSQKLALNTFRALLYLPMLGSTVTASIVAILLVYPDVGPITRLLNFLHIPSPLWFMDPKLVLVTIGLVEFWKGSAFYVITYYAALSNIPKELIEASKIDGANYFQTLFYIILPSIKAVISFGVIMASIWSLQLFDSVYVLTRGGPMDASSSIVWYIYKNIFSFNKVGVGATMVTILMVITGIITFLNFKILRVGKE